MASYATEIEHRIIHPNWNSKSRKVGRLRLVALCDTPNERFSWRANVIGGQVHWITGDNDGDYGEWIMKCYFDGVAVFRDGMLSAFNYSTRRTITNLIDKYYYTERHITDESGEWNKRSVKILRRKACSKYYQQVYGSQQTFGDYLIKKYNRE